MAKRGKAMHGQTATMESLEHLLSVDFLNQLSVLARSFELRQPDAREQAVNARDRRHGEVARIARREVIRGKQVRNIPEISEAARNVIAEQMSTFDFTYTLNASRRDLLLAEAVAIDRLIEQHSKRDLPRSFPQGEDEQRRAMEMPGPTPETSVKARRHEGTLLRLRARGTITPEQASAGEEIAWIFENVTKVCAARIKQLDGAGGRPGGGAWTGPHWTEDVADAHAERYLPWIASLENQDQQANGARLRAGKRMLPRRLPFVIDICVNDAPIGTAVRRVGIGYDRGVAWLRDALDNYSGRM